MGTGAWPVTIETRGFVPVACGTATWRVGRETRVTAVTKATFSIAPDGTLSLLRPEPLVVADRHHQDDPRRSLRAASELSPYLPQAEVLLGGHAYPPSGVAQAEMEARLTLVRDGKPVLDKALRVQGPAPLQPMPLIYELSARHADENPVGVEPPREPNIAYAAARGRPAGFGPRSRLWPARRNRLGKLDPKRVEGVFVDVPDGFDWSYFQSAPDDQRVDFLRGDEEIHLAGLHPMQPRVALRLTGARAAARVYGLTGPDAWVPIEMRLDMVVIDVDAQACSLVWRGSVVAPEASLPALRVVAGIELPGAEGVLDDQPDTGRDTLAMTGAVRSAVVAVPALPFAPSRAAAPPIVPPRPAPRPPPEASPGWRDTGEYTTIAVAPSEPVLPFLARAEEPAPPQAPPEPRPPAVVERIFEDEEEEDNDPTMIVAPLFDEDSLEAIEPEAEGRALPSAEPDFNDDDDDAPEPTATMVRDPSLLAAMPATPFEKPRPAAGMPARPAGLPRPPLVPPPPRVTSDSTDSPGIPTPPLLVRAPEDAAAGPSKRPPPLVRSPEAVAAAPSNRPPALVSRPETSGASEGPRRARVAAMLATNQSLEGIDLTGADLTGLDFTGRSLRGAVLAEANLRGCTFARANLSEARLDGAILASTSLDHAKLEEASLVGVDLSDAKLDHTKLTGADFSDARGARASFQGARGVSVVFAGGDLTEANFQGSDLQGADFTGAVLDRAAFSDAVLVGAIFARASCHRTGFVGANLAQAVMRRARLPQADFSRANLTRAQLERADLRGADLRGASLHGADADKAIVDDALLDGPLPKAKPRA